jgi:beta-lactamase class A
LHDLRRARLLAVIALPVGLAMAVAGCGRSSSAPTPTTPPPATHVAAPPEYSEPASATGMTGSNGETAPAHLDDLAPQLAATLQGQQGTYGLALLDLNSGEYLSLGGDQVFPAASTFKLPLVIYALQQVDRGHASLDETMAIEPRDMAGGSGTLQYRPLGSKWTLGQLIDKAIIESDNVAHNMLKRRFGHGTIWAFMETLGGTVTHDENGDNLTTPADLVRYMRAVLDPQVLSDTSRERLLHDLRNTVWPIRIEAGTPSDIEVAHKIGTFADVVNDVGLVSFPGRPYILAICSKDVTEPVADGVLTELSRQVYAHYRDLSP